MTASEAQLALFDTAPESTPKDRSPEDASPGGRKPNESVSEETSWPLAASDSPRPEDRQLLESLQQRLDGRLESLVLTDNRQRILTVRPVGRGGTGDALQVRLHRAFAGATEGVLDAVTVAIEGAEAGHDRESRSLARRVLRQWMERFWLLNEPSAPQRRSELQPTGFALDLRQVQDDLNRRFFDGRLSVDITWSRVLPGVVCRTRSIRLGSYEAGRHPEERGLVRIHPALDQPGVPRHVVESVVYHELLHADIPAVVRNGRRHVHTPEFRRRERQFPEYTRAKRWIRKNLQNLLRY